MTSWLSKVQRFLAVPRNRYIVLGGVAGLGLALLATSKTWPTSGYIMSTTNPPMAPWRNSFDSFWSDNAAIKAKYANHPTLYKEDMFNEYLWPLLAMGGGPQATSPSQVQAFIEQCAYAFGQPPKLIRAIMRYESGQKIRPFAMDQRSTAAGLGSTLLGSAISAGIPHPEVLWWMGGVWATCKEMENKHWPAGIDLPFPAAIESAAIQAGSGSEPIWFKSVRAYYSLGADKLAKSTAHARQRLLAAHDSWESLMYSGSGWNAQWTWANSKGLVTSQPAFVIFKNRLVSKYIPSGMVNGDKALAELQAMGVA